MAYGIQDPLDLARILVNMSYGGLTKVAAEFVSMNENGERDIKTTVGMAETLFDWAEAKVWEAEEADKERKAAAAKAAA